MRLATLDWLVIGLYVAAVVLIGAAYARRAGRNVEEFFLSGRTLPWWITGTSMVATSFAADTPLVVTGWVRDGGIWKNWIWWCFLMSGVLSVFLFARWWRRGGVMTKAELAELRYGGRDGRLLRGVLGALHASVMNTLILCWVLLAAAKIMDVLLGMDKIQALVIASSIAMLYSLLAGFWGVVLTDLPQFAMAVIGAVVLAVVSWAAVGGVEGVSLALASTRGPDDHTLSFFPTPGPGGLFDASFWSSSVAALAVYLGVSWWAVENVDGSGAAVQRIAASRDERQGMLAVLWFNVAHYALRPWPWILVALASLVVLPTVELTAPVSGVVASADSGAVVIRPAAAGADTAAGGEADSAVEVADVAVPLILPQGSDDWRPRPRVKAGDAVTAGDVVAVTDSERAYVVMMARYLPVGILGLAVAALIAAFMSTIDTHVNLAASFFVNDVWRRFIAPDRVPSHYVLVARLASAGVMCLGAVLAWQADSISDLFLFFLAFLGGVGPVYVARWLWWRVRAVHEIVAMLASAAATTVLTFGVPDGWHDGPLAPGGVLAPEGRLCLVVATSLLATLAVLPFVRAPDPRSLVDFYRRVRPMGAWGPVAALAPDVVRPRELLPVVVGVLGALACILGAMLGAGLWLLARGDEAAVAVAVAVAGTAGVRWSLARLRTVDAASPPPGA
jgi:Na+/proline symporter